MPCSEDEESIDDPSARYCLVTAGTLVFSPTVCVAVRGFTPRKDSQGLAVGDFIATVGPLLTRCVYETAARLDGSEAEMDPSRWPPWRRPPRREASVFIRYRPDLPDNKAHHLGGVIVILVGAAAARSWRWVLVGGATCTRPPGGYGPPR